jgi:Ketopantoate reductase PanE/ApbA/Ketopantoate reductase PanE/ApbA C terminal
MNPRDGGFADLVLFCVKAYDTETAAERLRPTIGPETVILPVQNGIDSAERIGRVVGSGHVIGGTAGVSSVLESPGIIDHRSGPDEIRPGELDGQPSARVERIAEVLRRAGIKAEIRLDIRVALWEKFVRICGLSGLTALTPLPIGAILACAETRTLLLRTMDETVAVGRAENVIVPDGFPAAALHLFERHGPGGARLPLLRPRRRPTPRDRDAQRDRRPARPRPGRPHAGELRHLRGAQAVRGRRTGHSAARLTDRAGDAGPTGSVSYFPVQNSPGSA